jgi:DNA-binding response OmpR family regulator
MKVLIAEDDKFLASAYRVKLNKLGFEVKVAVDGIEALQILVDFQPDVILLDLIMPNQDGFVTLEKIKADEKMKSIPVIVTSNLGQEEDINKAKELGADDYIVKADMELEDLVEKIKAYQ